MFAFPVLIRTPSYLNFPTHRVSVELCAVSARSVAAVLRVDEGHGRRPGALHAGERPLEQEVIVEVAVDRSRRRKRPPVGEPSLLPRGAALALLAPTAASLTSKTAMCAEATGLPLKKD